MDELNEELFYWVEVGLHQHRILYSGGRTAADGSHSHVFIVPEDVETSIGKIKKGTVLSTGYDGAHDHGLEFPNGMTAVDGEHAHGVRVRGSLAIATERGGAHSHQLGTARTGEDGSHSHTLMIAGMSIPSLTPAEFARLITEALGTIEPAEPATVTRDNGHFGVKVGGQVVTHHKTVEGARRLALGINCAQSAGLVLEPSLVLDSEWLGKAVELVAESAAGRKAGLLGSLARLVDER